MTTLATLPRGRVPMPPDALLDATALAMDGNAIGERMALVLAECYQKAERIATSEDYADATRRAARLLMAEMERMAPAVVTYRTAAAGLVTVMRRSNRRLSGTKEAPVGATTEA